MNSFVSKMIAVLLGLFLLAYVCYQTFVSVYNPYQTQTVTYGDYVRDIDLNGFFVRDESTINVSKNGVVSYKYKNAQRVSNGATIAEIYGNERDLMNLNEIEALKREKEILEQAQNKETIEGQKLDLLNSQVFSAKADLIAQVDENDFTNIKSTSEALMLLTNKVAVCVDNSIAFEDTISSIDAQIASLEAMLPEHTDSVQTENSGYFSSGVDGYEELFTPSMLKSLTVKSVSDVIANKKTDKPTSIGKIVNESIWNFVSIVPQKEVEYLQKPHQTGASVKLRFNSLSTREIEATVTDIIIEKDSDMAVVVFNSLYVDNDLINMRFETPKVILGSYSGIIIPKEAIRLQDGAVDKETGMVSEKAKGVNTLYGKSVKFKLVDVVYEDSYVLISRPNEKASYVAGYDQVIVKGKDINVPSPK